MGKVEYATAEALEALKEELRRQVNAIQKADQAAKANVSAMEVSVKNRLQELEATSSETTQVQSQYLKSLQTALAAQQEQLSSEASQIKELKTETEELQKGVAGVQELAQKNYEVLQDMQKKAREEQMEELRKAREDLQQHALEAARKDATEAKDEAKKELEGAKKAVRGEMSEGLTKLQNNLTESMKQSFDALDKNVRETREALQAQCDALREETKRKQQDLEKDLGDRMEKVTEDTKQRLERLEEQQEQRRRALEEHLNLELQRMEESLKDTREELSSLLQQDMEDLKEARREAEARSAAVLAESRAEIQLLHAETARLNSFCSGVSGLATRQVEWRLDEETIKQLEKVQDRGQVDDPALAGKAQTSFFSPPFEAAGTTGLQLELRVRTHKAGPDDEDDGGGNQCSLYLWAAEGLQLVFRLFMGSESAILRHSFDGKAPCGLKRMGSLLEQKSVDGSLRLGIEIHESLVESSAVAGHSTNPMATGMEPRAPMDGALAVQRYLNHRLFKLMQSQGRAFLDQLHKKVDVMRSRAVRRVQWRLENGPMLFQTFAKDQAVRSTAFQAAGISGMQLVFYPQGCAGARPGFCSLFLSCPPGCTLRCWLWAGRWRREARPEPGEQPDLVGRVNFARFENVIDPVDECVELVLEIEEASQARKVTMSSQPMPLEDSEAELNKSGVTSMSEASKEVGRLERADTAVTKIQHNVNKPLADGAVQQLPSIWTTQAFHSFSDLEENSRMHTASTVKAQSSPATPRMPPGRGKRKGPRVVSARDGKYKEYSEGSQPLPSY